MSANAVTTVVIDAIMSVAQPADALYRAVLSRDGAAVARLALDREQFDYRDEDGNSPIHLAAWCDNVDALRILLAVPGANVDVLNVFGATPTHIAAGAGHVDSLRILLEYNPDLNILAAKMPEKYSQPIVQI